MTQGTTRAGRSGIFVSQLITVSFVLLLSIAAKAGDRPANVSKAADAWLKENIDQSMPMLLQTEAGPMDPKHIFIVQDLGEWGAARAKGKKHQGTDFVLDLPNKSKATDLYVGAPLDGKVVHVERAWGAYGNTVFIYKDSAPKMVFILAHLASVGVEIDADVQVGDVLGTFGCTGNCRGLKAKSIKNQVHVEVYSMPDDFEAEDLEWAKMPLRQLRAVAEHKARKPYGVDIGEYLGDFKVKKLSRADLAEKYAKNDEKDLDAFVEKERKRNASIVAEGAEGAEVAKVAKVVKHGDKLEGEVPAAMLEALAADDLDEDLSPESLAATLSPESLAAMLMLGDESVPDEVYGLDEDEPEATKLDTKLIDPFEVEDRRAFEDLKVRALLPVERMAVGL